MLKTLRKTCAKLVDGQFTASGHSSTFRTARTFHPAPNVQNHTESHNRSDYFPRPFPQALSAFSPPFPADFYALSPVPITITISK